VPLFAAASSHYASAGGSHAPRLVTLDEAFAGVDDDSRAKCLGLLRAFDLDVVMTSEREWACYPQVPGIAIAQLSRVDDIAAVLVTRWEWDGRDRRRGTGPDGQVNTPGDPVPAVGRPKAPGGAGVGAAGGAVAGAPGGVAVGAPGGATAPSAGQGWDAAVDGTGDQDQESLWT
jgi:hypothetical protein